jgi:lauroyl/myristoyl acyltransferase
VGWARRILGDYHVTGLFWLSLPQVGDLHVAWLDAGPIIVVFTTFFFLTIFNIRRAIGSNLVPVLGPCGFAVRQRRIYKTMWSFAWCLSERYERLATSRKFRVEVEAIEHWWKAAAGGGGLVMVTAHLGMYEAGSMLPAAEEDRRVHLVRSPRPIPARRSSSGRACARWKMRVHDALPERRPPSGVALLEALRRGEVVAMQADRPRSGSRTVSASLFGRPVDLPGGPSRSHASQEFPSSPSSPSARGGDGTASCSVHRSGCPPRPTPGPIWARRCMRWPGNSSTRSAAHPISGSSSGALALTPSRLQYVPIVPCKAISPTAATLTR